MRDIWTLSATFSTSVLLPRMGEVLEKFVLYLQSTQGELEERFFCLIFIQQQYGIGNRATED